jgi:hypothetical protein
MNSLNLDDFTRSNQELGIQKWDTTFHEYIGPDKKQNISCTVKLDTGDGRSASYTSIASPENCGGKDDKETLRAYAEGSAYSMSTHRLQTLINNDNTNYNRGKHQNYFSDGYNSDAYGSVKSVPPSRSNGEQFTHSKSKHMSDKQKGMILGRCNHQRLDAERISKELFNHSLEACTSYEADKIIKHVSNLEKNDDY